MTRFVFRADGSSTIGFGHLTRAVSLARSAQRAGAEVVFVLAKGDRGVQDFVRRVASDVRVIDVEPGTVEDAIATEGISGPDAVIVVDGYAFRARWFGALRRESSRVVAYVDDLARERLDCDVVINPNVSAIASSYELAPKTMLLAGPGFAIVDDHFVAARGRKQWRTSACDRVLVTMGGSDPPGATLRALEALSKVGMSLDVRVIVGAANRRRDEVVSAVSSCAGHTIDLRFAVEDMAAEMLWADVVVAASGVTSTEISCVGVPGVVMAIVDNQEPIAMALAGRAMFDVVELRDGAHAIARALRLLLDEPERRRGQVEAQRRVVDGAGKDRVVARLLEIREARRHTATQSGGDRG